MANISCLQFALLSALLGFSSLADANSYTLVALDYPPVNLNNSGEMAANSFGKWFLRAKLFRNGQWHNLPPRSLARAINKNGEVAGIYTSGDQANHSALWPRKGSTPIHVITEAETVAYDVNGDRMLVGTTNNGLSCFVWSPDSGFDVLPGIDGGEYCEAHAVNELGQVTGGASTGNDSAMHVFIWKQGKFTDLGRMPGTAGDSIGTVINRKAHVAGYARNSGSSIPFYWDGSNLVSLDSDQHRYRDVEPLAINGNDEIVGYTVLDGSDISHAVRFAGGKVIDLSAEVVNLGDWKLEKATGINDNGVIAGTGNHGGFMLVPK